MYVECWHMIFLVKSQLVIQSFNTFSLCPIRYGHHGIAADIFQRLTYSVSSEHFYFWLMGLGKICNGEHGLNDVSNKDLVERLSMASSHILEGLSSIFSRQITMSKFRIQPFNVFLLL